MSQGYALGAKHLIGLHKVNPQIAGRLCAGAFSRWRRFDPARQKLMRAQLERIVGAQDLSRDVFEIASKTLGA